MTDTSILRRVQALLSKAESTEFDAEREALIAKAQELMVAHAIDQAQLDQARPRQRERPIAKRLRLAESAGYSSLRENLIAVVTRANRCQLVYHGWRWDRETGRKVRDATIVGFPDDVAWSELLYTSLLVQLFGGAQRAWRAADPDERRYGNRKTFTVSYGDGFITAISKRLREASQQAQSQAEARQAGAALVLADRTSEVTRHFEELFPRLRTHRRAQRNRFSAGGWSAGEADGRRANLNRAGQVAGSRRSLPGRGGRA